MRRSLLCAMGAVLVAIGCRDDRPPSNFVLFVLDTTRFDAVSSAPGATPAFDALAREGLRYTRAFAQAPWTFPSHVTMFTGLLPSQHGAGWRETRARDDLVTLAERLRAAGYQTFGVSENPWVSASFNLDQGFDRLVFSAPVAGPGVVESVTRWLADREPGPFFLFVNVLDAHAPYALRAAALPDGVSVERARAISQDPAVYNCSPTDASEDLRVLRALYQAEVSAADAKLAAIVDALQRAQLGNTVTIVVSDHGELFGENGLVSHQFSVHNALLHVPLLVHGLPGVEPARLDQPVGLVDLMPSILSWAGIPAAAGPGRPLPLSPSAATAARDIVAEYADPTGLELGSNMARSMLGRIGEIRAACGPADRVFGTLRSVVRYPFKLVESEGQPPALYDLERDPEQRRDLAADRRAQVAELSAALGPRPALGAAAPAPPSVTEPVLDALEELGYLGGAAPTRGAAASDAACPAASGGCEPDSGR